MYVMWKGMCEINNLCKCLWVREETWLANALLLLENLTPWVPSQATKVHHSEDPPVIYYRQWLHCQAISWNSIYTFLHKYRCSSRCLVFILPMTGRFVHLLGKWQKANLRYWRIFFPKVWGATEEETVEPHSLKISEFSFRFKFCLAWR